MTATAQPTLSAAQAKALVLAEVAVGKLEAELDAAKQEREKLRKRYKVRLQPSTEKKDRGKDVVQAEAGGFLIRCSTFTGGSRFSLKSYIEAGHKITAAMRDHISPGDQQERWSWKDLRGPRRPDAVEINRGA
jgi:hypothetical protein